MLNAPQQDNPPQRGRRQFMFLLILTALMLLPLESIVGTRNSDEINQGLFMFIGNPDKEITSPQPATPILYNSILHFFDTKRMQGTWRHKATSEQQGVLNYPSGKVMITFGRQVIDNAESTYAMVDILNGNYIDHGYAQLMLPLEAFEGNETLVKGNYTFYTVGEVKLSFSYVVKLETMIPEKELNIRSLNISFQQFHAGDKVSISVSIDSDQFSIDAQDITESWHTFSHLFLSLLLTFILVLQFRSTIGILKKIGLGQCPAEKYSLLSFFMIIMWDFAITLMTFFLSFSSDQLFLIYLIPTFLSGMLFAITELRILQLINDSINQNRSSGFKQMLKMSAWMGFIAIYPIIIYTNLSSLFFALLPLIFLPQLYKNAERGQRSQIDYDFLQLFLPRFVLILYIKAFSKNVFNIEPSLTCCLGMLAMIALMMGLMMVQKLYGNRIIFPKFLLPQVYNYFQDELGYSVDVELGVDNMEDCAICLTPVHMQPLEENQMAGDFVGKVMTTPCKHKFHGTCLVQWMQHKMECPTCRSKVPAYD